MEISASTSEKTTMAWFRWQYVAGPLVGILGASYLQGLMQAPLAWAIGGMIWGAFSIPIVTDIKANKRAIIVVYHGALLGFLNWLLGTYF